MVYFKLSHIYQNSREKKPLAKYVEMRVSLYHKHFVSTRFGRRESEMGGDSTRLGGEAWFSDW